MVSDKDKVKPRKYGNPVILNQLDNLQKLKDSGVELDRKDMFARSSGVLPSSPPVVNVRDKIKPAKKKRRGAVVNVYVDEFVSDLLTSMKKQKGLGKSESFKTALRYYVKHKLDKS